MKNSNKTKVMHTRVTWREIDAIRKAAAKRGITNLSKAVRMSLNFFLGIDLKV